jgi:glycosyltransferase involved in cell wall biosynthesis
MLYEQCHAQDLRHYNLVIFTRPRYPDCSALMDECKKQAIGTLVMIDDNWITIARERPRYQPLFGPGQPALETFLYCLRQADQTVVYNPILAEDIAPFARKVTQLAPYIDPSAFACEDPRNRGTILAGYSGSPRPDTPAFQALAHFAERHSDVELLCLGPLQTPPELLSVDPSRICSAPFQVSYEGYAKRIGRLSPDILLAPLDDSRTSASKAPNKFLEISVVGAAGIYSRVAPYTRYVRDGETGLLVDNQEQCWTEALERLYCDRGLLAAIAAAARKEVLENYSLDQATPCLLRLLAEVAR